MSSTTTPRPRPVRRGAWPAVGLTVLILVALALPVYGDLGRIGSSTLLHGYDLDTWGFWALAVGARRRGLGRGR